ncbi:MAG: C40 family peptidase [candidate division KSB1 bacterium]|nr:C40 family peptidase [candidate division KSB1 bacterium]
MTRKHLGLSIIILLLLLPLLGCVLKPRPIYKPYPRKHQKEHDAKDSRVQPEVDHDNSHDADRWQNGDFGDEGVVDEDASYTDASLEATEIMPVSTEVWKLANELIPFLNTPYKYGGEDTTGVDCSGLVKVVYERAFGISLPHKAAFQYKLDIARPVARPQLKAGDLVFFYDKRFRRIGHVGIYLNNGYFIHSMIRKGVVISNLSGKYWKKFYAGARRILKK